ncbi:MAG: hypothetical protein JW384_00227 [Nitrosomonadaceae bacterium]|nr:hypothetical protein [Nitrosomonadaceae bacterium]
MNSRSTVIVISPVSIAVALEKIGGVSTVNTHEPVTLTDSHAH